MDYIKTFPEIGKDDAATAGGKGASLGEMTNASIPVPPGFVVLASAFEEFLRETDVHLEIDAILATVNKDEMRSIEHAAEKIQGLILHAAMPTTIARAVQKYFDQLGAAYVAVRSSASAEDSVSAAWAGQLDSYLNTTEANLIHNVQRCWASLFTPRAIFYRFEKDLHATQISVAVVVQKMVESELSGVAFSVHPITEDKNQLIIEAGYGLGEAIVSGQITPDSYVVEKTPRQVVDINVHSQTKALYRASDGGNAWHVVPEPKASAQVLTEEQVLKLAELIVQIENLYGFACDIEWAYEEGRFYIVQSRPITTLSVHSTQPKSSLLQEIRRRDFECSARFPRVPFLYIEAMNEGQRNNPLFSLADTTPDLSSIVFLDESYEGWVGQTGRISVSALEAIEKIDQASRDSITRNQAIFETVLTANNLELSDPQKLTQLIEAANAASTDVYKHFIFFIYESFKTSDQNLIEQLQKTRMDLDTVVSKYLFPAFKKLVQALVDNHAFSQSAAERLTTKEIIACLENPSKITTYQKLQRRASAIVIFDNQIEILFDTAAKEILVYLHGQDPDKKLIAEITKNNSIYGKIGNKGVVTGRVRKLLGSELHDTSKLQSLEKDENYVLVVSMTAPELVPYFKNAVAYITDEGGITCHAAIIARELGIPCVIGTKIATQVLTDGELVEVDADNGIVRRLAPTNSVLDENHLSLSEWFAKAGVGDENIFRNEDNEKRERLKKLHAKIGIPFDTPTQFSASDIAHKTESFSNFLHAHGSELCALRLIPIVNDVPKLRMRGLTVLEVTEEWFPKQAIDLSHYRADFMPHSNQTIWSTIFIVNQYGIFGEMIEGAHDQLTAGHYKNHAQQYRFSYDFRNATWQMSSINEAALAHLKDVVACLRVDSRDKRTELATTLSSTFHCNYLAGYFESVLSAEFGLWFIDYNRILGNLYESMPLPTYSPQVGDSLHGTVVYGAGRTQGVVVVLQSDQANISDIDHLIDLILVAPYTMPQHLPLMKRAAAIITEEGGLLSHASIISRELGIPCIVGVEGATKILQNGDLITLDADKGVIEIQN